jgi:hypothetical protein
MATSGNARVLSITGAGALESRAETARDGLVADRVGGTTALVSRTAA